MFPTGKAQPACSANKIYPILFQLENLDIFKDAAHMVRMHGFQPGRTYTAKTYRSKSLVFFFSDKEATSLMYLITKRQIRQ